MIDLYKPMNSKIRKTSLASIIIFLIFFLNSCGIYKYSDARKVPPKAADKRQKNLDEGRGFRASSIGKKGGGQFDFSTSNEMWRASLEILDFVPLVNADYGGGIIITDWYKNKKEKNESLKITVHFLSNEIRADGIKILIHKKICITNENCDVKLIKSNLGQEIKLAILKKATIIKRLDNDKRIKEEGKYEGAGNID